MRQPASLLLSLIAILILSLEVNAEDSCTACHGNTDFFDEAGVKIVTDFQKGVHASVGVSCADCHGGNPDLSLREDIDGAMSEGFADNPYSGVPEKVQTPEMCGKCHSDPVYMRRFKPDSRVDQEQEYWTSHHGQALKDGDTKVATCSDCHGVHGILRATDPASAVYPTNVAKTCSTCHADGDYMAGYTLEDGRPLPTDQYVLWQISMHGKSLMERGDLFAPTCNDCHGNHGAAPPGVESVAFVCGQCHGREAELFRASSKHDGFQMHNELLADAGAGSCQMCHESLPDSEAVSQIASFSECESCHGNHAVSRPTVTMLSPLPETPCAFLP